MARYTPTRLLISLLAVLSLLIFLIHSPSSSPIQALRTRSFPYARWIEDWTTQPPRAQNPLTAPPSTWAQAYEDERMSLLEEKNYDAEWMAWAIGTPEHNQLGGNLTAYLDRLNRFVDTYFEGSPSKPALKQMLRNLGHHVPPPLLDQPMRRKVFSTCKGGKEEVPEGFNQWERRLGPVGWEVEVADDDRMQEWFSDAIKGDGFGLGEEKFRRIWDALPKQVLRSDLLRYLMILIHGGIYTDSDTQPRSHPFLWGTDAQSLMPPSLKAINRMLQSYSRHPAYDDLSIEPQTPESPWNYADSYHGGIGDDDVAFVASIEWDSFERELGENWCCGYCRALQVVQWTIMAKPFHPIMLDVLETVVNNIEKGIEENNLDGTVRALDLTGPGPFTDAVYRYLLAQYGVTPLDLVRRPEINTKIGDVILLPEWSFAQPAPQPNEWDFTGPSPTFRCVSHGFMGRWKKEGWGD